jgi:branched-chain amino acid transport system permease protein
MVGGLILGIALAVLDRYVSNDIDTFYTLVLLVVVLMLRPAGLFSRGQARRV